MSNTFFAGQTNYIEKLNVLALANDVANIPANAAAAAASANSASTSATDASTSATSALSSKNLAATSAQTAVDQVAIIGTAATIATAASSAQTAKIAAEAARDAALIQAGVYTTEALGRAAVADGQYFKVAGSGDVAAYEYQRTDSATSVLRSSYPSSARVETIGNQVLQRLVGVTATAAGSVTTDGSTYFYPDSISSIDQWIDTLSIAVDRASTARIIVASVSGGNLTLVSSTLRTVAAGVNGFADLGIPVPAGCVVGMSCIGNYFILSNPSLMWSVATSAPSNTAYTVQENTFSLRYNITLRGAVAAKAVLAYNKANALDTTIGSVSTLGWSAIASGASTATPNTFIFGAPVARDSTLTKATVWMQSAAALTIIVASRGNTASNFTLLRSTTVQGVAGLNEISVSLAAPVGSFLGIYSPASVVRYTSGANTEGYTAYQVAGMLAANAEPSSTFTTLRFEMGFTLSSGLYAAIATSAVDVSGIYALASADNTGIADSTSKFSAALTNFNYPYVPAGQFSITSISKFGRGLYGPGKVYVAGTRYFILKSPSDKSLQKTMRSRLAQNIVNNDVLSFVGDSITHYVGASAADKHYLEMLTQYANFGVSADKPTMTALVNSNGTYTPTFYGVTLAGTVSNGGGGPLSESLILAVGASLSFTGTFEQIDCFYRQNTGAGTLTFAFNGTTFKTVNANGSSEPDKFSGPTLTAQTGSGTYSITASVASVEVTGLVRLGILAADGMRLRTSRCAHGGYYFSSFNAAAVASIVKQGTYAGGKCVPVLALGTNDSFSLTTDQVVTNAQAVISLFIAAGITKMFAIPPFRQYNEVGMLKLRKLYADNGIVVIGTDSVDWWNSALLQDAVHPNDSGYDLIAQIAIEGMSA
jgi:hypothetical protein